MLELNFVENVMLDRFKDHISRSYHFSMIKRVVKGFKYDELFIEFNNDRPVTYYASFPLQRDFIVEVINLALDEIKYLRGTVLQTAEFYAERTKSFLIDNANTYFPTYNNWTGRQLPPDRAVQYTAGIFLPRMRQIDCDNLPKTNL